VLRGGPCCCCCWGTEVPRRWQCPAQSIATKQSSTWLTCSCCCCCCCCCCSPQVADIPTKHNQRNHRNTYAHAEESRDIRTPPSATCTPQDPWSTRDTCSSHEPVSGHRGDLGPVMLHHRDCTACLSMNSPFVTGATGQAHCECVASPSAPANQGLSGS
jgi:hypothetical protein